MATTILAAESSLVEKMLLYTDWAGDAEVVSVPYAVTIATKREAEPRRFVAIPTTHFPAVAVQIVQRQPGQLRGQQQDIVFTVRMSVINQFTAGEEPTVDMRTLTGKIIENILQTQTLLASNDWLGLDWISMIPFPNTTYDNDLERYLRNVLVPQEGSNALGFVSSQTDWTVTTVTG